MPAKELEKTGNKLYNSEKKKLRTQSLEFYLSIENI